MPSRIMEMVAMVESAPKLRTLFRRRLILLASVAGLGLTVLVGGSGFVPQAAAPVLADIAYAQGVQRPVGFADIVEKVKPAVISVGLKMGGGGTLMNFGGKPPLSPTWQRELFSRRFGRPEGVPEVAPRPPRNRLVTGQGSGFFISADGYAVTNNHVVDKA